MFLRGHSTLAETAFRGYRIIGNPANMFMERRLITLAFHRNSSISLQEYAMARGILTFLATQPTNKQKEGL